MALKSVELEQPEKSLVFLLEAWRETKDPSLASVVERLGARVKRPELAAKPADAALKAWLACEKKADDADLHRLLAALQIGKVKEIIQRLEVLARRAPDPRLTSVAATCSRRSPSARVLPGPSTRRSSRCSKPSRILVHPSAWR